MFICIFLIPNYLFTCVVFNNIKLFTHHWLWCCSFKMTSVIIVKSTMIAFYQILLFYLVQLPINYWNDLSTLLVVQHTWCSFMLKHLFKLFKTFTYIYLIKLLMCCSTFVSEFQIQIPFLLILCVSLNVKGQLKKTEIGGHQVKDEVTSKWRPCHVYKSPSRPGWKKHPW